jgi:hypothetical protein
MDSIDISDFAFSLGNISTESISSTTETIKDNISNVINNIIPESVSNIIPESVSNIIPESVTNDNTMYIIFFVGIVVILGFFAYYYFNKTNKKVTFQDPIQQYPNQQTYYNN